MVFHSIPVQLQILKEEITPTLAKLKEERSSYLEYQKVIRELEHLNKLYIAWQFMCAEVGQKESSFASLGDSGYLHLVYRHLLSAQQLSDSSSPKQHCKCSFSGADGQKIHSHCNRLAHTFWFNSITFRLFSAFVSGIQRKVCPGFDPDS